MKIRKFLQFIEESYLEGSRAPLYHITHKLAAILASDTLKMGKPSRASHGNEKSISLTRNIDFTNDGFIMDILEIDSDALRKAGIKSYPVDEIMWDSGKRNDYVVKVKRNLSKSGFDEFKKGMRGTKHGTDMPKEWSLEYEYEERIYQDVENLGRYIMSISLRDIPNVFFVNEMSAYLEKYPHIRVFLIEGKNARKRKDITDMFVKTKSKKAAAK